MGKSDEKSIGAKIRELRKELRLTQPELAKKMGVIRSAVAKWEAGNHLPLAKNIKKLDELGLLGIRAAHLAYHGPDGKKEDSDRALRLSHLTKYFEKQMQKSQPKRQQEGPSSEQILAIGRLLEVLRSARDGSEDAQEILNLSARSLDEVERRRSDELKAARHGDIRPVVEKFSRVYSVQNGRAYLVDRYVVAGRRELGRLGVNPPEFAYIERMINTEFDTKV